MGGGGMDVMNPLRSGSTALTSPPTSDNPLTAQNYKLSSM